MKAKSLFTMLLLMVMILTSQTTAFAATDDTLQLQIGDKTVSVTLADNTATKALRDALEKKSITVNMSDYGGFEKVGSLGISLPTSNENITTESGDLVLYQGNQLVIFYGPNTWSYTRLGKINDLTQEELKSVLGSGNVTVTLSLNTFGKVPKTGVPDLASTLMAILNTSIACPYCIKPAAFKLLISCSMLFPAVVK